MLNKFNQNNKNIRVRPISETIWAYPLYQIRHDFIYIYFNFKVIILD